jgi:pilus assembly protein CpaE
MTDGPGSPSPLYTPVLGMPSARVFTTDPESQRVIRQALSDLGLEDFAVAEGNAGTAAAALRTVRSPKLLVVDITGVDDMLAGLRQLAEVCEPDTSVVAIGERNDIVLYRQLRQAGVSEYFFKPLVRDRITACCHDILADQIDQPGTAAGKLVFVLGVGGGTGATTIATNAAWHQAEEQQRWTLLLDLDVQSGDAALQLDTAPTRALQEALEDPSRVDKLFLERGVIHVTERLHLLASLEPLNACFHITDEAVGQILDQLLRRYRLVIADLPAAAATCLPLTLQRPGVCLLTASASLTCARDMARWRDLLGPNTRERRTLQVLNHTAAYGGLPDAEFTRASGQAPDAIIGYDRQLAEAANFGTRAMQECSGFNADLARMLADLTGDQIKKPPSLFKRIFGR